MGAVGARDPPDVVGLTLIEGGHEPLQLLPEARSHAVELVCALASSCHARGRSRCCAVNIICVLKQAPAEGAGFVNTQFKFCQYPIQGMSTPNAGYWQHLMQGLTEPTRLPYVNKACCGHASTACTHLETMHEPGIALTLVGPNPDQLSGT